MYSRHGHERKAPGRVGGLPAVRIEVREVCVFEERSEFVAQSQKSVPSSSRSRR
jgi:hypothetical protein